MGAKPSLPKINIGGFFNGIGNSISAAFKGNSNQRSPSASWLPPPREDEPPAPPPVPPDITPILNSIRDQFNYFLTDKTTYANNQIKQVNKVFGDLTTNTLAEITDLVRDINDENKLIQNQIDYNIPRINKSNISTWVNQQPYLDSLKYQNYILYIIFYVLVLGLGAVMFYLNNTSFMFQAVVFHVLLIYPFLMYYFELLLFIIYSYLYAFLYGVPYKPIYIGNMDIKFT